MFYGNRQIFAFIAAAGFFLFVSSALACTPCQEELDLTATIQQADLIIVGQYDPQWLQSRQNMEAEKPAKAKVKILQTLKGSTIFKTISVPAWSGMCPYGIVFPSHETRLIFLDKKKDAINQGCAVKTLKIENEKIQLDDKNSLSLDQFKERYLK